MNNLLIEIFKKAVEHDIDYSVEQLQLAVSESLVKTGFHSTTGKITKISNQQPQLFDKSCHSAKRNKYKTLNLFRQTNNTEYYTEYISLKNHFRNLCKQKKKDFENKIMADISKAAQDNDCKIFWKLIKKLCGSYQQLRQEISGEEWLTYFKRLLNPEIESDAAFNEYVKNYILDHIFANCEKCAQCDDLIGGVITEEEIKKNLVIS